MNDIEELKRQLLIADLTDQRKGLHEDSLSLLVARIRKVAIHVYSNEGKHSRPHFHARINEDLNASYAIDPVECLEGELPRHLHAEILQWARTRRTELLSSWYEAAAGRRPLKMEI